MSMEVVKAKPESLTRWMILFLTCVMMIGNYYCYDIPAALNTQMDDYFGKQSDFETMFSLLYTVYSVPNIILPFFGGFFTDKFGARICMIVFCSFITLGQLITALGLSMKSWPVMLLGRVVYGIGGESLGVANSAILSEWFKGKELAFAFGINLSIARLGSVINNLVSPTLADDVNIQFAFWFGVILCGSSVLSAVLIASFDKHFDKLLLEQKGAHGLLLDADNEEEEEVVLGGSRGSKTLGTSLLGADGKPKEEESKAPEFREVFDFKHIFWIITVICVVVYGEYLRCTWYKTPHSDAL
jgi:MFS family permease